MVFAFCVHFRCSHVAGVCGPLVQRLGMDEIFADVTDIIRDLGDTATSASQGGTANAPNPTASQRDPPEVDGDDFSSNPRHSTPPGFNGHLYAPGSGGTLLEAQTGLEISLHSEGTIEGGNGVCGGGGVIHRGTHSRGSGGDGSAALDPFAARQGQETSNTALFPACGLDEGGGKSTDHGSLVVGQSGNCTSCAFGETTGGGVSTHPDGRMGTEIGKQGRGSAAAAAASVGSVCRCGCVRRLATTSVACSRRA